MASGASWKCGSPDPSVTARTEAGMAQTSMVKTGIKILLIAASGLKAIGLASLIYEIGEDGDVHWEPISKNSTFAASTCFGRYLTIIKACRAMKPYVMYWVIMCRSRKNSTPHGVLRDEVVQNAFLILLLGRDLLR